MRVEFRGRTFDIQSDEHSWAVAEVMVSKKGDEYRVNPTYHPTVEGMARHLLEFSLRKADADTLQELSSIAFDLRGAIRKAFDI